MIFLDSTLRFSDMWPIDVMKRSYMDRKMGQIEHDLFGGVKEFSELPPCWC